MTLRLRNTLSRKVEPVVPLDGRMVRMYTCGPTVYRYAHLGNLRTFMLADLIRRALLYHGIPVRQVKNITDVGHMRDEQREGGGDRVLVQAELEGRPPADLAAHYEAAFHGDEALVNILPAHVFPRATEHVAAMIALAEQLEDAGHAYRAEDGTLYFEVGSFAAYGALSGNTLDHLRAGHRGPVAPGKRGHADFALWKLSEPGRRDLSWPSRWGVGFPGWHLECSAMSGIHLGQQFDIHTGGVDNIFPHHEDEIAQTAPLTGAPPARLWVHSEHLLAGGRKMAKSAGNIQRPAELGAAGIEPLALRYLCLTARYGHKLHASVESLSSAAASLASLRTALRSLGSPPASGEWAVPEPWVASPAGPRPEGTVTVAGGHGAGSDWPLWDRAHQPVAPLGAAGRELHAELVSALDDNLNLPEVLSLVRQLMRAPLPANEKRWLALDADLVLGLDLHLAWQPAPARPASPEVERLMAERRQARLAGDYARADVLREELADLGVKVSDAPAGSAGREG